MVGQQQQGRSAHADRHPDSPPEQQAAAAFLLYQTDCQKGAEEAGTCTRARNEHGARKVALKTG
jgi:hypothetical protein